MPELKGRVKPVLIINPVSSLGSVSPSPRCTALAMLRILARPLLTLLS